MIDDPNGQNSPGSTTSSTRHLKTVPSAAAGRLLTPAGLPPSWGPRHRCSTRRTSTASRGKAQLECLSRQRTRRRGTGQSSVPNTGWGGLCQESPVRPQKLTPRADASRRRTRAQVCLQRAGERGPWVCPCQAPRCHGLGRRRWEGTCCCTHEPLQRCCGCQQKALGSPGILPAAPRTLPLSYGGPVRALGATGAVSGGEVGLLTSLRRGTTQEQDGAWTWTHTAQTGVLPHVHTWPFQQWNDTERTEVLPNGLKVRGSAV